MLLAALAATIAVTLFADQQRWTRAVEHRRDQVQAQAMVFAGVQWARQILNDDARATRIDHLGEPWAIALPPIPLENGEIRGSITDAQARLNVNALAGDRRRRRPRARRASPGSLRSAAVPPTRSTRSPTGSMPTASPRPNGAEDAFYARSAVPGVAANAPVDARRRARRTCAA